MRRLISILVVIAFSVPIKAEIRLEDMNWTQRGCTSSHTGSVQWNVGPYFSPNTGPIVLDGVIEGVSTWGDQIIIGLQNNHVASVSKNNQALWNTDLKAKPIGVPAIANKTIFIQTSEGNLVRIDPYTGKILMETPFNSEGTTDVAISGSYAIFGGKNQVMCIDFKSNLRKWHFQTEDVPQPISVYGSFVVINHQSKLSCLNLFTGKKAWEVTASTRGIFTGTPVVGSGLVFISTLDNKLKAFSIFSGSEIWTKNTVSVTPVTFDDGQIYFPSTNGIYCCKSWDGQQIWKTNPGNSPVLVWSQLARTKKCLIVACKDGKVYILNHENGKQLSTVQVSNQIVAEIAVGNDYLAVPDNTYKIGKNNKLYLFISKNQ